MFTTIKELLVAHKLFNKTITLEELLRVEFDSAYLLNGIKRENSIEINSYYGQRKNSNKLYLTPCDYQPYMYFFKSIKLNLYTTIFILDFLQIEDIHT